MTTPTITIRYIEDNRDSLVGQTFDSLPAASRALASTVSRIVGHAYEKTDLEITLFGQTRVFTFDVDAGFCADGGFSGYLQALATYEIGSELASPERKASAAMWLGFLSSGLL